MAEFHQIQYDYSNRVNRVLDEVISQLSDQNSLLIEAMRYGTLLGGKRLRPFIVYATGEMLGVSLDDLDKPAAAIECIHAYSLIHDDLPAMDNDSLRRGQPTCHIKYGQAHAILAGDALQTLAFTILSQSQSENISPAQSLQMIQALATASGAIGMCAGQALDLESEGKSIPLSELEKIHTHKTGAIIRCATRLAVISSGKKGEAVGAILDQFSAAIGLAFQVQDDILDVIGESDKIGKTKGADLRAQKSTYPALLGLEKARQKAQDLHQEALKALSQLSVIGYDTQKLKTLTDFIIQRDS